MVAAWSEEQRFENKKIGGTGVEVETDIFVLSSKRKNKQGRVKLNRGYIQFLGERGGEIFLDIFQNPRGGAERMFHVSPVFDEFLED